MVKGQVAQAFCGTDMSMTVFSATREQPSGSRQNGYEPWKHCCLVQSESGYAIASSRGMQHPTMTQDQGHIHNLRFGCTAKVLAECKLKYYRISGCIHIHTVPSALPRDYIRQERPDVIESDACVSDVQVPAGDEWAEKGAPKASISSFHMPCRPTGRYKCTLQAWSLQHICCQSFITRLNTEL